MRVIFLICLVSLLLFTGCDKTRNNVINTTSHVANLPFFVEGLTDITFTTNFGAVVASRELTIKYNDSAQQYVTLSVHGLPAGMTMDTNWTKKGYPTFSTQLILWDTAAVTTTPGVYHPALVITTQAGVQTSVPFNLTVLPMPLTFLGKYASCINECNGAHYTDSVYLDSAVADKIWFANYANSGNKIYGIIRSPGGIINIPSQVVGGIGYTGGGNIILPHYINILMTGNCNLNLLMQ